MSSNIVGCFDDASEARAAQHELISSIGIPADRVRLVAQQGQRATASAPANDDPGFWESIKEAFGFADDRDRTTYGEAARRGGVIVSADVPDNAVDSAVAIMRRHGVVDLDQRAAEWRQQGWTGGGAAAAAATGQQRAAAGAATGQEVIPVVQEDIRVGKRQIETGGVRVYSRVVEQPVEEQIELRQERVNVERRPVDRPVTNADDAFRERAVEVRQTGEEAVVQKHARVVEEIAVNKTVEQQAATVRDTVRRTEVDVQSTGSDNLSDNDLTTFVTGLDERYRGRDWASSEPEIRRTFEQRYQSKDMWDRVRDRVRGAYETRSRQSS